MHIPTIAVTTNSTASKTKKRSTTTANLFPRKSSAGNVCDEGEEHQSGVHDHLDLQLHPTRTRTTTTSSGYNSRQQEGSRDGGRRQTTSSSRYDDYDTVDTEDEDWRCFSRNMFKKSREEEQQQQQLQGRQGARTFSSVNCSAGHGGSFSNFYNTKNRPPYHNHGPPPRHQSASRTTSAMLSTRITESKPVIPTPPLPVPVGENTSLNICARQADEARQLQKLKESARPGERIPGVVKFFMASERYGFITIENGADIFVHANRITGNPLARGDPVTFTLAPDKRSGKLVAYDVRGGSGGGSGIFYSSPPSSCGAVERGNGDDSSGVRNAIVPLPPPPPLVGQTQLKYQGQTISSGHQLQQIEDQLREYISNVQQQPVVNDGGGQQQNKNGFSCGATTSRTPPTTREQEELDQMARKVLDQFLLNQGIEVLGRNGATATNTGATTTTNTNDRLLEHDQRLLREPIQTTLKTGNASNFPTTAIAMSSQEKSSSQHTSHVQQLLSPPFLTTSSSTAGPTTSNRNPHPCPPAMCSTSPTVMQNQIQNSPGAIGTSSAPEPASAFLVGASLGLASRNYSGLQLVTNPSDMAPPPLPSGPISMQPQIRNHGNVGGFLQDVGINNRPVSISSQPEDLMERFLSAKSTASSMTRSCNSNMQNQNQRPESKPRLEEAMRVHLNMVQDEHLGAASHGPSSSGHIYLGASSGSTSTSSSDNLLNMIGAARAAQQALVLPQQQLLPHAHQLQQQGDPRQAMLPAFSQMLGGLPPSTSLSNFLTRLEDVGGRQHQQEVEQGQGQQEQRLPSLVALPSFASCASSPSIDSNPSGSSCIGGGGLMQHRSNLPSMSNEEPAVLPGSGDLQKKDNIPSICTISNEISAITTSKPSGLPSPLSANTTFPTLPQPAPVVASNLNSNLFPNFKVENNYGTRRDQIEEVQQQLNLNTNPSEQAGPAGPLQASSPQTLRPGLAVSSSLTFWTPTPSLAQYFRPPSAELPDFPPLGTREQLPTLLDTLPDTGAFSPQASLGERQGAVFKDSATLLAGNTTLPVGNNKTSGTAPQVSSTNTLSTYCEGLWPNEVVPLPPF
ncbi:unnamed protein product [Amoebophrya sp. A25]|nr:unnamed protein product [Amoebophrya sp. A25]|eukprot:GSA25T00026358001.1